jgi:hypothetical protein
MTSDFSVAWQILGHLFTNTSGHPDGNQYLSVSTLGLPVKFYKTFRRIFLSLGKACPKGDRAFALIATLFLPAETSSGVWQTLKPFFTLIKKFFK